VKALTPRARAVARYLLGGWNTEGIARELTVKEGTVRTAYYDQIREATGKTSIIAATLSILRDPDALSYVMEVE
jgi:DNA-binding NarL/FixJ family response regulator